MTSSEKNSPRNNDDAIEADHERIVVPKPEGDKDELVSKYESRSWDRESGEQEHEVRYYFNQDTVGHIWQQGIKEVCSSNLNWQEFQQYVSNNHQEDATSFGKGSIDWDELVRRIENGIRRKIS